MDHVAYIGIDPKFSGHEALMRPSLNDGMVLVQFDRHDAPDQMAFGWHEFPASDWVVRPPIDWSEMDEPRGQP